ncbi:intracellular septation protein A [Oxalobacteraceae bacterium GrIS 1.18]
MKISFSLLWRIVILQLVFNLLLLLLLKNTRFMLDANFVQWKAPVLYICFGLLLLVFQIIKKQSLVALVFGARLNLTYAHWRALTLALVGYCIVVASADILIAQVASFETWNQFKLFAPLVALILLVSVFPRVMRKNRTVTT